MSDSERIDRQPVEKQAFKQLEKLVHHLGDELTSFRRRAQQAEAKLKAIEVAAGTAGEDEDTSGEEFPGTARIALVQLRKENAELKARLATARGRTKHMMDRVRFLRQQHQQEMGVVGVAGVAK